MKAALVTLALILAALALFESGIGGAIAVIAAGVFLASFLRR